jgi:hypothetical protein
MLVALFKMTYFGAGPYNGKRKKFRGFQVGGAAAQEPSVKQMSFSSKEGRLQGKHLEELDFFDAIAKIYQEPSLEGRSPYCKEVLGDCQRRRS